MHGATEFQRRWLVPVLLAGCAAVACSDQATLRLRVVVPPGDDPFTGVAEIWLTDYRDDDGAAVVADTLVATPTDVASFSLETGLPVDGQWHVLDVEGYDADGEVRCRGRSAAVRYTARASQDVSLVVRPVGRFSAAIEALGTLADARCELATAWLPDYGGLLAGGQTATGAPSSAAALYDVADERFVTVPALLTARRAPLLVPLADGGALCVGGFGGAAGATSLRAPERLAPEATAWQAVDDWPAGPELGDAAALALPAGGAWITGGRTGAAAPTRQSLVVGADGAARLGVELPDARAGHVMVRVQAAGDEEAWHAIVGGGAAGSNPVLVAREVGGAFAPAAAPAAAERQAAAAVSLATEALVVGGSVAGTPGRDALVLRAECAGAAATCLGLHGIADVLQTARAGATATALPDGQVLVVGGRDAAGQPLATAERLRRDDDGHWNSVELLALLGARAGHAALALPDGLVWLAGGCDAAAAPRADVEYYVPWVAPLPTFSTVD